MLGHRWSEGTHEVKTFLTHNHVPYRWLEVDQGEEAERLLELAGAGVDDLPVVALPDGEALRSPTTRRARRGAGAAHAGRPASLRPVHRGRGSGRARRRRVRGVRGPADRGRRAGRARADRRARARPSRTTWASPRGSPAPTSPTVRSRRRPGSGRRWCSPATSPASRPADPCAPYCSTASAAIEARAVLVATGVSYRRLEAPGLDGIGFHGVTTARAPARRCSARARTSTSWGRPTRPARPR